MKFKIVIAGLLLPLLAISQPAPPVRLAVGDRVPPIVFTEVINYRHSFLDLNDYKGRVIILDFWATTCLSCIYHMPVCDSLQTAFGDQIQIILVNPRISKDGVKRVNKMMALVESRTGHHVRLPVALYDDVAYALFPFHFLPHYVWIGSDGIVKAITDAEAVTATNISALLAGKTLHLPRKND